METLSCTGKIMGKQKLWYFIITWQKAYNAFFTCDTMPGVTSLLHNAYESSIRNQNTLKGSRNFQFGDFVPTPSSKGCLVDLPLPCVTPWCTQHIQITQGYSIVPLYNKMPKRWISTSPPNTFYFYFIVSISRTTL